MKNKISFRTKIEAGVVASILIVLTIGGVYGVTRTISGTQDNIETFIRNSNGKYWTATASNIQLAIWDLNDTGGIVYLPGNSIFNISSNLNLNSNIELQGKGISTVLNTTGGTIYAYNKNHIKLSNFKIIGRYGLRISANINVDNFLIENIEITTNNALQDGAFYIYINNCNISNIVFRDCFAFNCSNNGFLLDGEGNLNVIDNILFENCHAKDCGIFTDRINDFITGFDLGEFSSSTTSYIKNMVLINCISENSWESGYHFEDKPICENIKFINCLARNNGKDPTPTYASGFMLNNYTQLFGCSAINNTKFGIYMNSYCVINNCYIDGGDSTVEQDGIRIIGDYSTISNNVITNCYTTGVRVTGISGSEFGIITGNIVYDNGNNWAKTGILVYKANNYTVTDNVCYDTKGVQAKGIYVYSGSRDCIIVNNNCFNNTAEDIDNDGTNCIVKDNKGYDSSTYQYIPCSGSNPYLTPNNGAMYFVTGNQSLAVYYNSNWYFYEHD